MKKLLALCACCVLAFCGWVHLSHAHKPSYSEDGKFSQRDKPYPVSDVDLSIVVYHKAECKSLQLWMSFEVGNPRELFVQLGVPKIVRLLEYRPLLAILMPGLPKPKVKLPFELPEGYGAKVFDVTDVTRPSKFHEPFTNTTSILLLEQRVPLPKAGKGYIVAWHPKQTGKYWVAVGEREEFGPEDFKLFSDVWFDKTQAFHEVGEYETNNTPSESVCEVQQPKPDTKQGNEPSPPPAQVEPETQPAGMGCQVEGTPPSPLGFALVVLLLIGGLFRRR